jgi:threonine dehydrogenase-like Zn-dependent dehydrogenase
MKNPGLYVTPDCKVYLADTPVPEPAKDELLIRVRATGVCGQVTPKLSNTNGKTLTVFQVGSYIVEEGGHEYTSE